MIREEFTKEYRGVVIDDRRRCTKRCSAYVEAIAPELADRIEFYDPEAENLPLFEKFHVHEQLHKALDRKVWLPSGGSLVIERTEALTVIDVNTGKNVGTSNLEETVYRNNLEAAEAVARQLRLRDIGGIIVIDFIDMEIKANREAVEEGFRQALARDKTRTQVFSISELGLLEMTRKRVSEGLVEAFSSTCPHCNGRGFVVDESMLDNDLDCVVDRFSGAAPVVRPTPGSASISRFTPSRRRGHVRGDRRPAASSTASSRATGSTSSASRRERVELRPVLLVDGDTCSPRRAARGRIGHGPGRRRGQGPEDQRLHLQEQEQPAEALGPPPEVLHDRDHRDLDRRRERDSRADTAMSKKKGAASSRNGRDSNAQRLGVKRFSGQSVTAGTIIVRQRGTSSTPASTSAAAATTRCSRPPTAS